MSSITHSVGILARSAGLEEQLVSHLSARYNINVSQVHTLDLNVFRVNCQDGTVWVARIFPPQFPLASLLEDAEILHFLEQQGFPAESLAHPEPVSTTSAGNHILITSFIEGRRHRKGENIFSKLGDLLGRLHTLPCPDTSALTRKGGAWHHICYPGGPREEIDAAISLLDSSKTLISDDQQQLYNDLQIKIQQADDLSDLPQSFNHPDFVPSNSITTDADGSIRIIDWTGAGTGPRIAPLAYLLWAAGQRSMAQVKAVVAAYGNHISLENAEIFRLKNAILLMPLILSCWEFCTERRGLEDVMERVAKMEILGDRIGKVAAGTVEKRKRAPPVVQ
jgi:Ser/Thr protein kinase RdoA (MazF antagonist)